MEKHKLSMQETERINEAMHLKMRELDRVIDQAGKLVSQFTNYPAFALTAGRGSHLYLSVRPADGGSQQLYRGGHD